MEKLLLVDTRDEVLGSIDKMDAHTSPHLHRAFSVLLYHKNQVLIQRRAVGKYHSGGLWANTCCSHPRTTDTLQDALARLTIETGISVPALEEVFGFVYYAKFDNGMYEYEYDHVFLAEYNGGCCPNPDEVAEMKWVDIDILLDDMTAHPQNYAVWFLSLMPRVAEIIKQKMS